MPIFCVKSVKIYTGQKKFTRTCSWGSWQISGMIMIQYLDLCNMHATISSGKPWSGWWPSWPSRCQAPPGKPRLPRPDQIRSDEIIVKNRDLPEPEPKPGVKMPACGGLPRIQGVIISFKKLLPASTGVLGALDDLDGGRAGEEGK